jgi:Zn-dependent metalloprotease
MKAPGTAYNDPLLGKDPQPAHMNDYVTTVEDQGGVHINSGIPNRAFYVTAVEIGGFAWEKAGRIWYKTLTDKLGQHPNFQAAANATYAVAGDLYGPGSLEQMAVKTGWAAVGIQVGSGETSPGCLASVLSLLGLSSLLGKIKK